MKNLTIVCARVVRKNEQYAYQLKGKGERYLVVHEENENASDIVKEYLHPFAIQEPSIESITLQKGVSFIGNEEDEGDVWKALIRYTEEKLLDSGDTKEIKVSERFFLKAINFRDAYHTLVNYLETSTMHPTDSVVSINRLNVIDVI